MLAYWQHNVAENFLPLISDKKRGEVEKRKMVNEPLKVKKEIVKVANRKLSPKSDPYEVIERKSKYYTEED